MRGKAEQINNKNEKFKDYKSKEEVVKIAIDCMMYAYNGLPNNLTPMQGMNKWIEENL